MRGAALLLLAILSAPAPAFAEPLRITGRIANPHQGLQGILVELRPYPLGYADALRQLKGEVVPPLASARPAADGSFALQAPESGFFWVRVQADGRLPMEHFLPLAIEDTELPTVELPTARPLEVKATGPDGKPLAGVTLHAYSTAEAAWRPADRDAVTDAEGKATLLHAEGEALTLAAIAPGLYATATATPSGPAQTVRFPAPRSRTVEVRDGRGKPAAGALVRFVRRGRPLGLTGPDGRFAMPIPAKRELGLVVEDAKGLRLEVVMTQEAAEGTDVPVVTLRTPTAVTGRVLDGATRAPLAGALVWSGGSAWTRSGPQGDFEVRAPSGDEGRVEAVARDRMRDVQPWKRDLSSPLTLVLDPAGTIVGQVVDETGKPLARARVRTYANRPQSEMGFQFEERTSWSGPDGRFTLRQLPAGRSHEVTAVLEGFAPGRQSADAPAPGRSAPPVRIVLGRGSAAVGRVLTEDGLPVAGAELSLVQLPGPTGHDLEPFRAVSDGAGRFRFPNVGPGRFNLQVKRAGFAPAFREDLEIPAPAKTPQEVGLGDITLESGSAIEGRVADERGNPVAQAEIFLSPQDDAGAFFGSGHGQTLTGSDGRFRFPDLPLGRRFDLEVFHEGFVPASLPGVEAKPGSPLRIELREGRTLTGRVIDTDGEPIPKAGIAIVEIMSGELEGSGFSHGLTRDHARTDEEGRFILSNLEPGPVELQVDAPGFRRKRVPGLQIPERGEPYVEISLERGAAIEGRVLDGEGRPARGAMVRAEGERTDAGVLSFAGGRTDAEGRYRLDGLEVGPHQVHAESPERDLRAQRVLEVRPGTNRLDLTFPSGVEVSGQAVDEQGDPVPGATVLLWPVQSGQSRQTTSTASGSFTFTDVVEGEYRLRGSSRGFAASSMPSPIRVGRNPVDGLELRLTSGAVIRGRILGLAPEDRDDVHVSAHVLEGGDLAQGTVDAEGSYRIAGVGPGQWSVFANLSSASTHGVVEVRPGDEEVVLDLQLPEGFTLSGRILLDRAPLPGALVSVRGGVPETPVEGQAQSVHDGSFSISHLPPGSYTLLVALSTGVGHIQAVEIDGDQELTIEVQTGTLEGRLLSPEGLPVAGAVVSVTGQHPDLQAAFQGPSTRSDDQGYFELPRLAMGTYRVTAQAEGFAPAETRAVLTPGGTVRVELILSR